MPLLRAAEKASCIQDPDPSKRELGKELFFDQGLRPQRLSMKYNSNHKKNGKTLLSVLVLERVHDSIQSHSRFCDEDFCWLSTFFLCILLAADGCWGN